MRSRGATLILVVGVLAVLCVLGAGFYAITYSQARSALQFSDSIRAEMMAQAGLQDGIARLRQQAFEKTEDPSDPWYTVDYLNGGQKKISFAADDPLVAGKKLPYTRSLSNAAGPGAERYTLRVVDSASKININACDNLGVLLDNLCRTVGAPLQAADQDKLIPRVWEWFGGKKWPNGAPSDWPGGGTAGTGIYSNVPADIYYELDAENRPIQAADGTAIFGDGFAIAGYRARNGRFRNIEDVKQALTYVKRPGRPDLEQFEREVKFSAIREYITIDSWVDTNTVCVGKFEWVTAAGGVTRAYDRDKTWVADDLVNDPLNHRGSLRGCYLSIVNGHGAGQLRRVRTNGIDWIEVDNGFAVNPGPVSSYMIIAGEDAMLVDAKGADLGYAWPDNPPPPGTLAFPKQNADGTLVDNPKIDYKQWPVCIHRAPVNINTASDKVLASMFMGINVQYGTFMAIGTDGDLIDHINKWIVTDPHDPETDPTKQAAIATAVGVKRTPINSGRIVFDTPMPPEATSPNFDYINKFGTLDPAGTASINEANELAFRTIVARQRTKPVGTSELDPYSSLEKGPFKSWDDLFFRVVRPWDEKRQAQTASHKASRARMIMAAFNSNTDILKFNPNIEWIDRWGQNFSEMEPVMCFTDQPEETRDVKYFKNDAQAAVAATPPDTIKLTGHFSPPLANPLKNTSIPVFAQDIHSFPYGSDSEATPTWTSIVLKSFGTDPLNKSYGAYTIRTYRYKADEMIDKTDLNRSTTEFTFDSGGIYEISSVGQVVSHTQLVAEKSLSALVQVYDVWRETTQRQFAQGRISKATGQPETKNSGQVSRDATPANDGSNPAYRLALVTQPEPLVPLNFTIENTRLRNGNPVNVNGEVVDPMGPRDVFGNSKPLTTPDVIANKILPAAYDGQLILATNTSGFAPENETDPTIPSDKDTFLATFDGDLDTRFALANGREQAKDPSDCKYRVLDTCSLLGALFDKRIDFDQGNVPVGHPEYPIHPVFYYQSSNSTLQPLNKDAYWDNVTCRQGDLRTDGVYLSSSGISGRDGTLKYCFGEYLTSEPDLDKVLKYEKLNFNPGSDTGNNITMWMKPTWRQNDNRHHELFNATNPGTDIYGSWNSMNFTFGKIGRYMMAANSADYDADPARTSHSGRNRDNDFMAVMGGDGGAGFGGGGPKLPGAPMWNRHDPLHLRFAEFYGALHGGTSSVFPGNTLYNTDTAESPKYRIQPFRWHFTGMRWNYACTSQVAAILEGAVGHSKKKVNYGLNPRNGGYIPLSDGRILPANADDATNLSHLLYRIRPFIDSQMHPEGLANPTGGTSWKPDGFYSCGQMYTSYILGSATDATYKVGDPVDQYRTGGGTPAPYPVKYPADIRFGSTGFYINEAQKVPPILPVAGVYTNKMNLPPPPLLIPPATPDAWQYTDLPRKGVRCDIGNSGMLWHCKDTDFLTGADCDYRLPKEVNAADKYKDLSMEYHDLLDQYENFARGMQVNVKLAQDAKWDWADPVGPNANKIFGINNLNYSDHINISRQTSADGTFAVIDELKISSKDLLMTNPALFPAKDAKGSDGRYLNGMVEDTELRARSWMSTGSTWLGTAGAPYSDDRVTREQTLSRYYLPNNPQDPKECPTFTSQTMLQSIKGFDKTAPNPVENIILARVSWNVFTPRFMSEYKYPGTFTRDEIVTSSNAKTGAATPFKGPFDYVKYNEPSYNDLAYDNQAMIFPYRSTRPRPDQYGGQTHASKGVEIELLDNGAVIPGAEYAWDTGTSTAKAAFTNPDKFNRYGDVNAPVVVQTDKLQYRVRFRYPIDKLADPSGTGLNGGHVDPKYQYMLDTPVFDDISITYIVKPRILAFRDVTE